MTKELPAARLIDVAHTQTSLVEPPTEAACHAEIRATRGRAVSALPDPRREPVEMPSQYSAATPLAGRLRREGDHARTTAPACASSHRDGPCRIMPSTTTTAP